MPLIQIKMTDGDTLHIDGSEEQAQGFTKWFDEGDPGDVANMTDPTLGDVWIQKRHVVRMVIDRDE